MEIKKGISQMSEYPNAEINYVLSKDGKMNYVVNDGELENGCIIATLDPKHAIDSNNACDNIGVFSDNGDILIEFDKKDIKKVTEDLLLVVNSKPTTNEVIDAVAKKDDQISNSAILDNEKVIIDKMMEEMGPSGEIIFSDSYSEANVYAIDSYNNKLGIDCSFIGKNNEGLYFHTNDVNSMSKFIKVEEFGNSEVSEDVQTEEVTSSDDEDNSIQTDETSTIDIDSVNDNNDELKLDISKSILDGFKISNEDINESDSNEEESNEENSDNSIEDKKINLNTEDDEVLDNAIEIINRMIEETNKLNNRIVELENKITEQQQLIDEQQQMINEQEGKKDELNTLLNKANEVLENIK